jgi:hypothetical protein
MAQGEEFYRKVEEVKEVKEGRKGKRFFTFFLTSSYLFDFFDFAVKKSWFDSTLRVRNIQEKTANNQLEEVGTK